MYELFVAVLSMLPIVALIPLYPWKRRQDSRASDESEEENQNSPLPLVREAVARATGAGASTSAVVAATVKCEVTSLRSCYLPHQDPPLSLVREVVARATGAGASTSAAVAATVEGEVTSPRPCYIPHQDPPLSLVREVVARATGAGASTSAAVAATVEGEVTSPRLCYLPRQDPPLPLVREVVARATGAGASTSAAAAATVEGDPPLPLVREDVARATGAGASTSAAAAATIDGEVNSPRPCYLPRQDPPLPLVREAVARATGAQRRCRRRVAGASTSAAAATTVEGEVTSPRPCYLPRQDLPLPLVREAVARATDARRRRRRRAARASTSVAAAATVKGEVTSPRPCYLSRQDSPLPLVRKAVERATGARRRHRRRTAGASTSAATVEGKVTSPRPYYLPRQDPPLPLVRETVARATGAQRRCRRWVAGASTSAAVAATVEGEVTSPRPCYLPRQDLPLPLVREAVARTTDARRRRRRRAAGASTSVAAAATVEGEVTSPRPCYLSRQDSPLPLVRKAVERATGARRRHRRRTAGASTSASTVEGEVTSPRPCYLSRHDPPLPLVREAVVRATGARRMRRRWAAGASPAEKWLKYYSSKHKILLLGDGDFSFSLCLARAFGSAANIVATSLDSHDELVMKYKDARTNLESLKELGASMFHGVDVTTMKLHCQLKMLKFDRIVFNFPHAGFDRKESDYYQIELHKQVVHGFLNNAKDMLVPNGEIHVNHKTEFPYSQWNLKGLALMNSMSLIECIDFKIEDYPGYKNKRGSGPRCDEQFKLGDCSTFKFKMEGRSSVRLFYQVKRV